MIVNKCGVSINVTGVHATNFLLFHARAVVSVTVKSSVVAEKWSIPGADLGICVRGAVPSLSLIHI